MFRAASPYYYSPLLPDSIRLLCLLPHENENAPIRCRLFEYTLQESGKRTQPYDALSYVWGNTGKPRVISIGEHDLPVTENLYVALSHLRYRSIERVIWVDAVCINQEDEAEKEKQIPFMAIIYGQARCVVVWLGEAAENSDQALEEIRIAGGKKVTNSEVKEIDETIQSAILALFQRLWFRRIWILQEVAAARNILIMCGSMEIDGYAFCSGVESLNVSYEARADLRNLIRSVTYLIKGAIFRPHYRVSQDICPLGELVDMYHTHEATKRHDKVYALLGMSSDGLDRANLLPNYKVPWEELLQRLVKFLFHEKVSVETCGDKEAAVIKSKGCILGEVSSAQINTALDNRQSVEVISKTSRGQSANVGIQKAYWTLRPSAKSIRSGDVVCLLEGASKPSIVRICKDYFTVIMIAATPLEDIRIEGKSIAWQKLLSSVETFSRDFLLVWDWENPSEELQNPGEHKGWETMHSTVLEHSKIELDGHLDTATRAWDVALVLGDLGQYEKAEKRLQEAIEGYIRAFGIRHPYTLKSQYGLTPLAWVAGSGYEAIVRLLLSKDGVDPDLKDSQYGQTPLSWAAEGGHECVVNLLIGTGKVAVDAKDRFGQTPLSWAVREGHGGVVKLLLKMDSVDVNAKDSFGQTPLSWAAEGGHEDVVNLLLKTGKVEVEAKDSFGRTPLLWAAKRGHEGVVKLLLKMGKVDINGKDSFGQTPVSLAAEGRHGGVVKLLQSSPM